MWLVNQSSQVKASVGGYSAIPAVRSEVRGSAGRRRSMKRVRDHQGRAEAPGVGGHAQKEGLDQVEAFKGLRDQVESPSARRPPHRSSRKPSQLLRFGRGDEDRDRRMLGSDRA
jgi:hypothetical protein